MLYLKKLSNYITTCGFALVLILLLSSNFTANAQQTTGLKGWSIFIDQGHSQTENQGLYGYSEAEKTLRVGLALQEMLINQTDIHPDSAFVSRQTDDDFVTLSQRTTLANRLGVDFYYSIHSNAGSSTANNTLMLHGGWQENGVVVEKIPHGGKEMGDYLVEELTAAMRIPTIGNYADRTFYEGFENHSNRWPWLHVNRESDMASVLSEGGFHTNPTQQQRNMNAEWKRLEAQAAFWSVLRYMDADRPEVGIATGYITDKTNGKLLNGITVTIHDSSYTTDTYASLFNEYSNDPEELRNGFYYIENLPDGPAELIVGGPGYYSDTLNVDILNDDFTFTDIQLVSKVSPYITDTYPAEGDTTLNPSDDIIIHFSRDMDQASVAAAFSASENFEGDIFWESDTEMHINTDSLDFETSYWISIDSTAYDASEQQHLFDADGDGTPGGVFVLYFKTGPEDFTAPQIVDEYPSSVRRSAIQPIVSITFDEVILDEDISNALTLSHSDTQVPGTVAHYVVNERSVLNFFPAEKLLPKESYTATISGNITDLNGNTIGEDITHVFPTGDQEITSQIVIDDFDSGISAWWAPDASGSTAGYLPDYTSSASESNFVNELSGSSAALRINYGWETEGSGQMIRLHNPSTSPQFNDSYTLQAYIFGDGNRNQFRFTVRDSQGELESSKWHTVDWYGWRLITWNLSTDDIIPFANGDGVIDGNVYIDSFQLTYTQEQPHIGFFIADDLRAVKYGTVTSIEELPGSELPKDITLEQNYPNPFNPSTNIRFGVPQRSNVNLTVFDMLGRKVATIYNGVKPVGYHTVNFDASNLASGVYIYRLVIGNEILSKKMLLMK